MKISDIRQFPTSTSELGEDGPFHESCFRSYHVLEEVKHLMREGCPVSIVLELIDEMEDND